MPQLFFTSCICAPWLFPHTIIGPIPFQIIKLKLVQCCETHMEAQSCTVGVFEMPHIDLDISHFSIFRAALGLLEMPYIDLDISHLSSTRAPLLHSLLSNGLFVLLTAPVTINM